MDIAATISSLGNLIPSGPSFMQNIMLGAGTSVILAGLKSQAGLDAVDPLHIIHKDPQTNTTTSVVVAGSSITTAAFLSLPPDQQKALVAAGVHIS